MADDGRAPHQHIPPWFIAVFALAYISGYLIEVLYYASLGIVDAAGDIFKLKYIQTGIMFLLSSTLLSVFVVAWVLGPRMGIAPSETGAPKPGVYPTRYVIFTALCYVFSLYISVILTPLHYVETPDQWTGIILLVCLFAGYATVFIRAEGSYRSLYESLYSRTMRYETINLLRRRWQWSIEFRDRASIFFLVLTGFADIIFLNKRGDAFLDLLTRGGLIYVFFTLLIPVLLFRLAARLREARERDDQGGQFLYYVTVGAGGVSLCFVLFLTLMTYSYWIFPFIPSLKGGGDYEDASIVGVITITKEKEDHDDLEKILILYSTDTAYYFAKPEKDNTPCDWRAGRKVPKITEVRRDQIRRLVINTGAKEPNCKK